MSEILDALAALPPDVADILVMVAMFAAGLALGAGYAMWDEYRKAAKDDPPSNPTPRREHRRKHRDRRDHDA